MSRIATTTAGRSIYSLGELGAAVDPSQTVGREEEAAVIKTGSTLLLGIAIGVAAIVLLRSGDDNPRVGDGPVAQVLVDGTSSERDTASENEALRQRVAELEDQIADLQAPRESPSATAVPSAPESESVATPLEQSSERRLRPRNLDTTPALPAFPDFEIDLQYVGLYENGFTIPELLAAEPRDDRWALGTESFLEGQVLGATAAPMTTVQTECRTTWCGIVIEVPESIPRDEQRAMYLRIMESLGSNESDSRHYTFGRPTDSGGHIVLYYQVDR